MSKTITIHKCSECNHCKIERDYTSDSFETCFKQDCYFDRKHPKNIARNIDWYEKNPKIPTWCPR